MHLLSASLEEAKKSIEFLSENEKRLEKELAQSEHLRVHHEGESRSTQDELNDMEAELKQLRADLVKANMELSHSSSGQDKYRKLFEDLQTRAKELEAENSALRTEAANNQDETSRMQLKLDNTDVPALRGT